MQLNLWPRWLTGVGLVAGLLILAAYGESDPWSSKRHLEQITYPLNGDESSQLKAELAAIAAAANLDTRIQLNEPRDSASVGFYVIKSAARSEVGLEAGNAKYVPRFDVVLLDEQLVRPAAVRLTFSGVSLQPPDRRLSSSISWRWFVVLHELGHRIHHSSWRTRFRDPMVIEQEADIFALTAMSGSIGNSSYQGEGTLRTDSSTLERVAPADRAAVVISALAQEVAVSLLYGAGRHSTYFSDATHENTVSRFQSMLASIDGLSGQATVYRELAQAYLSRLAQAQRNVIREIHLPQPMADMAASGDGIRLTLEDGTSVSLTVRELVDPGHPLVINATHEMTVHDKATQEEKKTEVDLETIRTYVSEQIISNYALPKGRCRSTIVPNAIKARLHVTILCTPDEGLFVVDIEPPYQALGKERQLLIPDFIRMDPPPGYDVVTLVQDGDPQTYLFVDTSARTHTRAFEIMVWRLHDLRHAEFVARHRQISSVLPFGTSLDDWIKIVHPAVLNCDQFGARVTCIHYLDGEFVFDPKNESLEVLYYPPGGRRFQINEHVRAYWSRGGYKVYTVSLGTEADEN